MSVFKILETDDSKQFCLFSRERHYDFAVSGNGNECKQAYENRERERERERVLRSMSKCTRCLRKIKLRLGRPIFVGKVQLVDFLSFDKTDNLRDFLFASIHTRIFLKGGLVYSKRKKNAPKGCKTLTF